MMTHCTRVCSPGSSIEVSSTTGPRNFGGWLWIWEGFEICMATLRCGLSLRICGWKGSCHAYGLYTLLPFDFFFPTPWTLLNQHQFLDKKNFGAANGRSSVTYMLWLWGCRASTVRIWFSSVGALSISSVGIYAALFKSVCLISDSKYRFAPNQVEWSRSMDSHPLQPWGFKVHSIRGFSLGCSWIKTPSQRMCSFLL